VCGSPPVICVHDNGPTGMAVARQCVCRSSPLVKHLKNVTNRLRIRKPVFITVNCAGLSQP
jgi:hypothetical protein